MRVNGRLPPLPARPHRNRPARRHRLDRSQRAAEHERRHGAPPAGPTQPAKPVAQLAPEDALASAFSTAPGSARFRVEASLRAQGQGGTLELSGATDDSAKDPRVALDVKVDALGTNVQGGFVTTGGEAWFTRGDTGYLVPQEIWDGLQEPGSGPAPALPFHPAKWVEDVKGEGTQSIDGVETQHVSASLDTRCRPA